MAPICDSTQTARAAILAFLPLVLLGLQGAQAALRPEASQCNFCSRCRASSSAAASNKIAAGFGARRSLSEAHGNARLSSSSSEGDLIHLPNSSSEELPQAEELPEAADEWDMDQGTTPREELPSSHLELPHPKMYGKGPLWERYLVDLDSGHGKPNCTHCRGCLNHLEEPEQQLLFGGQAFKKEAQRQPMLTFKVTSPRAKTGVATVNLRCLPFSGTDGQTDVSKETCAADPAAKGPMMSNGSYRSSSGSSSSSGRDDAPDAVSDEEAVYRVAQACGVADVVPRTWSERIVAVMPETGYVVNQTALLYDFVDGISLNTLQRKTMGRSKKILFSALQRLKPKQIVSAALYDGLFAHSARHPRNVILDANRNLWLVNNDKVLSRSEGANSIFLPRSMFMAHNLFGRSHVVSQGAMKITRPSALAALDYRCHIDSEEGALQIGREFPGEFKTCLRKLVTFGSEGIMANYGMQSEERAKFLSERARAMLEVGFEAALDGFQPSAKSCRNLPAYAPCCQWNLTKSEQGVRCADSSWRPWKWKITVPCKSKNSSSAVSASVDAKKKRSNVRTKKKKASVMIDPKERTSAQKKGLNVRISTRSIRSEDRADLLMNGPSSSSGGTASIIKRGGGNSSTRRARNASSKKRRRSMMMPNKADEAIRRQKVQLR